MNKEIKEELDTCTEDLAGIKLKKRKQRNYKRSLTTLYFFKI